MKESGPLTKGMGVAMSCLLMALNSLEFFKTIKRRDRDYTLGPMVKYTRVNGNRV